MLFIINLFFLPSRMKQLQNLLGEDKLSYLDVRNRYLRNIYEIIPHKTMYFIRFLAFDTFPVREERETGEEGKEDNEKAFCYVFMGENLGNVYGSVYENFRTLMALPNDCLSDPCSNTVKFFNKVVKKYQQIYGSQLQNQILQKIFGSVWKQSKQFIDTHLTNYNPIESLKKYSHKNQKFRSFYCKKHKLDRLNYEEVHNEIEQKLAILPIEYDDDRLQTLLKMVRQLQGMYGFHLLGKKNWREGKKVLIKCDMVQLKRFPYYEIDNRLGIRRENDNVDSYNLKLSQLVNENRSQFKSTSKVNPQYNRLRIKFFKQILEQLLQYNFLTGTEYPLLHPETILYNTKNDHFFLSPSPIMIQGLGFQMKEGKYSLFKDGCYYEKQFMKSIGLQWSSVTEPLSNAWKMIMLMYYFQFNLYERSIEKQMACSPKRWLKSLFCIRDQQIQEQVQRLAEFRAQSSYEEFLHQQESLTKAILLLLAQQPDRKVNLFTLAQLFPLNYHVSTLSTTRHEQVLYLRYEIIKLMYEILEKTNEFLLNNREGVSKEEHKIIYSQNKRCYGVVSVLYNLIAMELRDVLRNSDVKLKEIIEKRLNKFESTFEALIQFFTEIEKDKEKQKEKVINLCAFVKLVSRKLRYIYNQSKKPQIEPQNFSMLYGKILKKILKYLQKNEIFQKANLKLYAKYFENKSKIQFLNTRQLFRVLVHLLLKMDQKNIHWCQYFVYLKIKEYMEEEKPSTETLYSLYQQIESKGGGEDEQSLWWGTLWPELQSENDLTIF